MTSIASGPATAARFIGESVLRREDPRLLTGRGTYVDDVVVAGMLHATFVRSDVARGRIVSLDVEAARAHPGVRAVLTGADLNPLIHETWQTVFGRQAPYPPQGALAGSDVRFAGDPIAIVIADSRYVAEDAAELVGLDVEAERAIVDADVAIAEPDRLVHAELVSNLAFVIPMTADPGLDEVFEQAPHVFTEAFSQHRYAPVPMETRGIISHFDRASGELRIWASTQGPHEIRALCARMLGIGEAKIRVTMGDVGGGFGQKMFMMREDMSVVLASYRLGRPIKWIEDRRENFIAATSARRDSMKITVAAADDGTLLAFKGDHVEDVGAYPAASSGSHGAMVMMLLPGPYKIPRLGFAHTAAYTNTCGRGSYRGPWLIESVVREQMVDHVARRLGLDPLEVRRRNVIRAEDLPYATATNMIYDQVTPAETLEQAVELIGYDDFRHEQEAARADGRYLGIGIGMYVEPTAGGFGSFATDAATVRVDPSGTVELILSSGGHGQSLETTMVQVVADHLGCPMDDVVLRQGDTAAAPFGPGTGGSRSAVICGGATRQASTAVRAKAIEIAAHQMEAAPEDLEIEGGVISVRGTPTRQMTLAQVAELAYVGSDLLPPDMEPGLEATSRFKATGFTWSNATHICTVEVDPVTGQVEILRYVVSEDCGPMINPMVVEGQIAGGVVQGIGGVLYEEMIYDDDANPLTTTFVDYILPTAGEVPIIEYGHVETSAPGNPSGFKGMGEGGAIGAPPTVINAIADALAPLGVTITTQPLGPSQILDLIAEARG